ncbi:alpha/beta hydrolase [Mycobacterium sp.]|uniref:alpha/beta fold hydrolase n=1 Tax=Mycobacterium sp. TaxID=1785 RepID=UPI0025CFC2C7|nr:alpha/beta hydrolase [Mycobacterium sp.]
MTQTSQAPRVAEIDDANEMLPMPNVDGVAHRWVTARDGSRIHVAEAGGGSPLVFIHGWPQHWYAWRAVIAPLAEHFRVICPDVRGLGWSSAAGSDWSFHRLAADIVDVMDALGVDRAGVVGHDWGSAIAYQLALSHARRVTRIMPLAGLHPWAVSGVHPRTLWRPWHVYTAAILGSRNNTWLQVPRVALRTWRLAGSFSPAEAEIYCGAMRQTHTIYATTQYYRNLLAREVPYYWRRARGIDLPLPVLHLNGANDPLTQRLSDAYRNHAPNMTLKNLPDCGHFIAEERPEELVGHVTEFFAPQE